jgi:hypothetical protein
VDFVHTGIGRGDPRRRVGEQGEARPVTSGSGEEEMGAWVGGGVGGGRERMQREKREDRREIQTKTHVI